MKDSNVKMILGSMICIGLDIHIWGGRRKLKPSDLKIQPGEIPPPDLASLGSLKVCDPDQLTAFDTLRKRAQRICLEHGVRFMGGYAIPRDSFPVVAKDLDQVARDFETTKKKFLADYDASIGTWIAAHPDWEVIVKRSVVSADKVALAFSFDWMPIPIENSRNSAVSNRIAAKTQGLAGRLYEEVAVEAEKIADKLLGQSKITQNSINGVRRLRRKLDGLQFLDQTISPVTKLIDAALNTLPPAGQIDGAGVATIHGLLYLMSDPNRMMDHGKRIIEGAPAESLAADLCGTNATATQVQLDLTATAAPTADTSASVVQPDAGTSSQAEGVTAQAPEVIVNQPPVETEPVAEAVAPEAETPAEEHATDVDEGLPEVHPAVIQPPASGRTVTLNF